MQYLKEHEPARWNEREPVEGVRKMNAMSKNAKTFFCEEE